MLKAHLKRCFLCIFQNQQRYADCTSKVVSVLFSDCVNTVQIKARQLCYFLYCSFPRQLTGILKQHIAPLFRKFLPKDLGRKMIRNLEGIIKYLWTILIILSISAMLSQAQLFMYLCAFLFLTDSDLDNFKRWAHCDYVVNSSVVSGQLAVPEVSRP